jgi:phosphohistidine phosphatase
MRIYLVRHGEAATKEIYTDRPLTDAGKEDSLKTAKFLLAGGIEIDAVWHSAKRRARETAEIFAKVLAPKNGLAEKEGLLPDDPVEGIFQEIEKTKKDIMIIGHIPFLQKLTSLALLNSGSFEVVKFNLSGVVCLEKREDGKWLLLFELIPEIVR